MGALCQKLTLQQWDERYAALTRAGLQEPAYGGRLARHVRTEGDLRLERLLFDSSPAALRLWNFLLTENQRLRTARSQGERLVATMKDLGTVPVIAYSLPGVRAFYPDGAWWTPCLMEGSDRLFGLAEKLGIDASFCPVRAMLGAFENLEHFPRPDLLVSSTGAVCDDFSAIAQRLERRGTRVVWWEMPRRREPEPGEPACTLPGGQQAPQSQVELVRAELERVADEFGRLTGVRVDEQRLQSGIEVANRVRRRLQRLRDNVYGAEAPALPALEMLVCEMLAIHFCSDRQETLDVLQQLFEEVQERTRFCSFVTGPEAVRVFWVNPVADLRAMNLLEDCGGRLCGSDFMFAHALDLIPQNMPPFEALARTALADPMAGPAVDRARGVVNDCRRFKAEAVVISRIPGASHCPWEAGAIRECVTRETDLPVIDLEVPSISDALRPALQTRLQALIEIAASRRNS